MKIFVDGIEQETGDLKRITIYGHGETLYTIDSGRIERHEIKTTDDGEKKIGTTYGDRLHAIHLRQPIKRAVKINLSRADNYIMKYTGEYSRDSGKQLFIHESEIAVDDLGEILAMETAEEKNYLHAVRLRFACPVTWERLHAEKIPCGPDWKLPAGGRWSTAYGTEENPTFDTYDDTERGEKYAERLRQRGQEPSKGVIKRWMTYDTETGAEMVTCFRYYTRTEYSPERLRKNALAERLNAAPAYSREKPWSHYGIDKLESALGYKLT